MKGRGEMWLVKQGATSNAAAAVAAAASLLPVSRRTCFVTAFAFATHISHTLFLSLPLPLSLCGAISKYALGKPFPQSFCCSINSRPCNLVATARCLLLRCLFVPIKMLQNVAQNVAASSFFFFLFFLFLQRFLVNNFHVLFTTLFTQPLQQTQA